MNDLIARVTSPGVRKYFYRVAWAGLAVAVATGKLDASQLEVLLGLAAAVLAVADSQTSVDKALVSRTHLEEAAKAAFDDGYLTATLDEPVDLGEPEWEPLDIEDAEPEPESEEG